MRIFRKRNRRGYRDLISLFEDTLRKAPWRAMNPQANEQPQDERPHDFFAWLLPFLERSGISEETYMREILPGIAE